MIPAQRRAELSGDLLQGLEEIACYMHWSMSKMKRMVPELRESAVLFKFRMGSPPRPVYCTFITLLQRWCILKTIERETL